MAGWNGAGVFTVPYTFVTDATAGIKILASRQDTQWATVVGGLMNCLCKDGQNAATGDINLGTHKIVNLVAGVAATDAANVGQLLTAGTMVEATGQGGALATTVPFIFCSSGN